VETHRRWTIIWPWSLSIMGLSQREENMGVGDWTPNAYCLGITVEKIEKKENTAKGK